MEEALAAAEKIAAMSRPAAAMAKEAINRAFETPLSEGMTSSATCFTPPSRWRIARKACGVHREAEAGEQEQVGCRPHLSRRPGERRDP